MQLAFKKHNSLMAEAQEGRGESRPLLCLSLMGRTVSKYFLLCRSRLCRL